MAPDPRTPISSRPPSTGHGLVVTFPIQPVESVNLQGHTIPGVRALFLKVLTFQEHYREYRELGAINAGAGNALDYDYLGETGHGSDADVLRLESDDFKVYHLGFAPRDPNLRLYEKLSASTPNRSNDHDNQAQPNPTNGDDFGFYASRQVPNLYDPPALTERRSIRNASAGGFLQFGFLADGVTVPDGGSDLLINGRTEELQPITDSAEQDFLLSEATLDREDQRL